MANVIELAQNYLPLLDEVYQVNSRTAVLDNTGIEFIGANAIKLPKISTTGLRNYDRNRGFVQGSVNLEWTPKVLERDRGISFMVDRMDNEESMGVIMDGETENGVRDVPDGIATRFGGLLGRFVRTHVAPEVDAYTFATLSSTSGINLANGDLDPSDPTAILSAIRAAKLTMNDAEVPEEDRILFVSSQTRSAIEGAISRTVMNGETNIASAVDTLYDMRVIGVPSRRFNTAITLNETENADADSPGFVPASGSFPINFMIVHPTAVAKVVKHIFPRIITPDMNQDADAYKMDYRIYYDVFTYDNKLDGIYAHVGTQANE